MKTDDVSEEAEEPPGNTPGEVNDNLDAVPEENEELEWARRHQPKGRTKQPETRPAGADTKPPGKPAAKPAAGPATGPAPGGVFRKTELWDNPPLFRSEEPVVREKILAHVLGQDTAIPYVQYEDAQRNLTGAIVQRQETVVRGLAREMDTLHDRLDALTDRIELVIDRLDRRIISLEKERDS